MQIFNIIITTKKNQNDMLIKAFGKGWDKCEIWSRNNWQSVVNPVIYSLKELRKNTWDVQRINNAIEWLEKCFTVKDKGV